MLLVTVVICGLAGFVIEGIICIPATPQEFQAACLEIYKKNTLSYSFGSVVSGLLACHLHCR